VEAMVFTDFPGERFDEAMATVRFLAEHADSISHFMFGSFALVAGSRVAANPSRYGIEAFGVAGDELTRQLFFRERRPAKREDEARVVDQAIERLSRRWLLRPYPFAGSISTAHSLLWLAASGPGVFRRLADQPAPRSPRGTRTPSPLDLQRLGDRVATHEAEIWGQMIWSERAVSRERWQELADELPPLLLPRSRRV